MSLYECRCCGTAYERTAEHFDTGPTERDGLRVICKDCRRALDRLRKRTARRRKQMTKTAAKLAAQPAEVQAAYAALAVTLARRKRAQRARS